MKLRIIANTPVGTFTSDIVELTAEEKESIENVLKKNDSTYLTIHNNCNITIIQSETLKNSVIILENIS